MDIVFDFGNVLVEWDPVRLIDAHYAVASRPGWTAERLAQALVEHTDWHDFDRGVIDGATLAARCAARLSLPEAPLAAFIERIPHVLPMFAASVAAVETLTAVPRGEREGGRRVLYLSNMPTRFSDVLEARCAWIARFDGGVFSGRVQQLKPDAAIYATLESRYGLEPTRLLFLDDSAANVAAARSRGWTAERIDRPGRVIEALADHGVLAAPPRAL